MARIAVRTISSLWKQADADGPVLVECVRSDVGRSVSHSHAIRARAEGNGRIVLAGPVLRHELDYLLRRVAAVPGITEAVNRLHVHADPSGISSLQAVCPDARCPNSPSRTGLLRFVLLP
jgi:hypothetical protein